jgi:Protein of unknown function (DUF3800)
MWENFPHPEDSKDNRGFIICDHTQDRKLRKLFRKMRRYNPIPHDRTFSTSGYRDLPVAHLIDDPSFHNSAHSYFIQAADLCAFLLYQYRSPNAYMRRHGGKNYFLRLEPILFKPASRFNRFGIVRL